jgi:hypothetical protein
MNDSELTGKIDEFVALMENETNAPVLVEKKVPVADIVNALSKKKDALVEKNAFQETCKSSLKTATQEAVDASSVLYDEFSSRIDAVAGLVGKKTPLGEQILKLRAELLRNSRSNGSANGPARNVVPAAAPSPDAQAA